MGEGEHLLLVEVQTGAATVQISVEVSPMLEIDVPCDPVPPLLSMFLKDDIWPQRYFLTHVHSALFTITR